MENIICPRCGEPLEGKPALSRKDGKTEICSECGFNEAIEDMEKAFKKKGEKIEYGNKDI